jgi:YHS domain-containing protein
MEMRQMAIDPICDMEVDEKTAKWVSEYKGKKVYFCAPGCKKMFDENPEKYAAKL